MHDDQGIELLCLSPEWIKLIAIIVPSVHVGADVTARQFELANGILRYLRRSTGILQGHSGKRNETVWILSDGVPQAFLSSHL